MKRIYSALVMMISSVLYVPCVFAENIPLYYVPLIQACATDNPGSSTVEPVDPNLVRAELVNNILVIYEYKDDEANVVIGRSDSSKTFLSTTFDGSLVFQLTDTATYVITLMFTDETLICGTFQYPSAVNPDPTYFLEGVKRFENGQLYILHQNNKYALPGTKVQ